MHAWVDIYCTIAVSPSEEIEQPSKFINYCLYVATVSERDLNDICTLTTPFVESNIYGY